MKVVLIINPFKKLISAEKQTRKSYAMFLGIKLNSCIFLGKVPIREGKYAGKSAYEAGWALAFLPASICLVIRPGTY